MKLPMAKIVLGTILGTTLVVSVKSMSLPANCPQDRGTAKVSGVVSHPAAAMIERYSIFIKLKGCKCEECKGKCSDCCIPQKTIHADLNGRFHFSLGPGT